MSDVVDDEFSELVDASLPRADLVTKGANGMPFLIAKSDHAAGLVSPETVRRLIAEPEPVAKERDDVTISGSPGAVMKMIHEAAQRASSNERGGAMGNEIEDVAKADAPDVEVTDVVADAPGGSTAESMPGSPDWEQMDAETALNAISVLGRVKGALSWLADREAQEAVVGGEMQDADNAFDLEDAACQLDCIIRRLAGFATTEQLEAEMDEELAEVGKSIAGLTEPLGVIESYGPVMKAGRVLSSANEAAIRTASDSLQKVLASLPAPIPDVAEVAKSDAKEKAMGETETVAEPVAEVAKAEEPTVALEEVAAELVVKAKGDPQVAVYTADGKLVGVVDQADISPIAAPAAPEGGDAQGADGSSDGGDDATAPVTDASELQPAPADAAGTPADAGAAAPPVAAPAATDDDTVAKSADQVLKAMIDEQVMAAVEGVRAEHAQVVKSLEDRIADLAAPQPARVLANGQLPPAHQMRGQDAGSQQIDVAKAESLRDELNATTDVGRREAIQKEMNENAAVALAALQAGARRR